MGFPLDWYKVDTLSHVLVYVRDYGMIQGAVLSLALLLFGFAAGFSFACTQFRRPSDKQPL